MSVDVITLGKAGVLKDPDAKIDYLMCCYFFTKYSQTTLFPGMLTSLTKTIQMYGNDPISIRREIQSDLSNFLKKFFTTAAVEVKIEDSGDDPGINLLIDAIVSDGDSIIPSSRSVGYSLMTKDSTLKSIVDVTNGKTIYSA